MKSIPSFASWLALGLALVAAAGASAQNSGGRSTSTARGGRNTTSGRDFPSWEGDVAAGEGAALPRGRPGHFLPSSSLDLGGMPVGVTALAGGIFAAALADGGVTFVDAAGLALGTTPTPPCTMPPTSFQGAALIVSSATLSLVAPSGVLWTRETAAPLALAPSSDHSHLACALTDGSLEVLDPTTGAPRWSHALGSIAAAPPEILRAAILVALVDGSVVGLDVTTGEELWRTSVGETAHSLAADEGAAWVAGRGRSSRTKAVAPVIARIPLADGGRRLASGGRDWRLRVGGDCAATPILLDDLVAFTCHDGYVHAINRAKGVGGWKTDLPARARHQPLLAGGRLDFVLEQTPFVVALSADNGAVLGWSELSDEDEVFVGPAAWAANVTVAGTSLGRLVLLSWQWDEMPEEEDEERGFGPGRLGATSVSNR
jgi:outer membrane protein assembly factor BamB